MRPSVLLSALALLPILVQPALGQGAPVMEEDFELGFPETWSWTGTRPYRWHIAEPGECGARSHMLAYNAGEPSCDYTGDVLPTGGVVTTAPVALDAAGGYLEIAYLLGIDVPGDEASIWMRPAEDVGIAPVCIADTADLNVFPDVLYARTFPLPIDRGYFCLDVVFELRFQADASGNEGCGWKIDHLAVLLQSPQTSFCLGDGSAAPCPCGNPGGMNEGCANSTGVGARLATWVHLPYEPVLGFGFVPDQPAVLVQGGTRQPPAPYGDGLRCIGEPRMRLQVALADADGTVRWGPGLARAASWQPPQVVRLQATYRDPAGPCGGAGFNVSAGLEVLLLP